MLQYATKRVANKWFVERSDGRNFGAHDTEVDANRQRAKLVAAEGQAASIRALHLHRALGTAKVEIINGREHLIVPVIALMEGVIHAVNAETPEFVPLATLQKAAASWNGKPVTLGHPKKDGKQCSAAVSGVAESHHIGVIRNSRVEGTKMLQEACIDKVRAKALAPDMWTRLLEDTWEEVSVGAFVVTDSKPGKHGEKAYKGTWLADGTSGDHLAFLPGGRGACSIAMGCGAHRAAMRVCETSLELDAPQEIVVPPRATVVFSTLEGLALDARIDAVQAAVNKRWNTNSGGAVPETYAYARPIFDSSCIVTVGTKVYAVPYDVAKDGSVTLGEATEVKQTWVAAKEHDCHCGGACDDCKEHRAAAGARHSSGDMKMIQTMHDTAISLGAACDRGNL